MRQGRKLIDSSKTVSRMGGFSILSAVLLLLPTFGCREDAAGSSLLLPVSGTVLMDGKPLSGAIVTFQATGGGDIAQEVSSGITDVNGIFRLRTLVNAQIREGIGPGRYRVVVSQLKRPDGTVYLPNPDEPPVSGGYTESLPSMYSDLMTTELSATVSEALSELNFSLNSSPNSVKSRQ